MKNSMGLRGEARLDTDSLKMRRHQTEERPLWHLESKNRSPDKSRFGHPSRAHGTVYQTLCIMYSIICEYDRWTYSDTCFSQYDFHTTKPFRLPYFSVFRTFHEPTWNFYCLSSGLYLHYFNFSFYWDVYSSSALDWIGKLALQPQRPLLRSINA